MIDLKAYVFEILVGLLSIIVGLISYIWMRRDAIDSKTYQRIFDQVSNMKESINGLKDDHAKIAYELSDTKRDIDEAFEAIRKHEEITDKRIQRHEEMAEDRMRAIEDKFDVIAGQAAQAAGKLDGTNKRLDDLIMFLQSK